ncbi:sulfite exporter TauE/SafE family protein [Aliikangiella sp. G2MR2-5]|uniref:sulfite exporter TauE/SafE family protein n=1 Tax=Aliikangiella sp. G2MR2-5 TaxID=2788943 RepID=UPI0018A8BE19|nr:sulfite exporter TauE/SafE family protein [Aliikangiella sp. G2MR2-5]
MPFTNDFSLFSMFILGLMGAGHCIGMCGGIISGLSAATENRNNQWRKIIGYQFGRVSSYTIIGLIFGLFSEQVNNLLKIPVLPVISAGLLILMGLYLSRLWMALSYFEKLGGFLWKRISPLSKPFLPVRSLRQAIGLGAVWGWLPCGLVYTALGYSVSTASALASMSSMLAFGLGTVPATLLVGAASQKAKAILNSYWLRYPIAVLMIAYGVYILWGLFFAEQVVHHHH